jgi:predicted secreted Zn-dependent protease
MPTRTTQSTPDTSTQAAAPQAATHEADTTPSVSLATLFGPARGASHQRALLHLQRTIGNARTARLIQRDYAVPAEKACNDVVPWLNTNSPYTPEWAETRSTYSFAGQATVTSEKLSDGTFKVMIKGNSKLKVKVNSPVDHPTWNPSPRPNRAAVVKAWQNMRSVLDAHENEHRKIAEQEHVKIEASWQSVDITATGATKDEAKQKAIADLQAKQKEWMDAAQAEQDKIDPFRGAVLACPAESAQSESAETEADAEEI